MGFQSSVLVSQHTSMVLILNAAFGGGGETAPKGNVKDVTEGAPTFEHALHAMNNLLSWG